MAWQSSGAVSLDNKCRMKGWSIDWTDVENIEADPLSRWASAVIINGRQYAWGYGPKKGRARDDAAAKVLDVFGEDSSGAVSLENKCRMKGWSIDWLDVENIEADPLSRWASAVIINDGQYAWGYGAKKGHARDVAAAKVLDMFGEDSIEQLDKLVVDLGLVLEWNIVPGVGKSTVLVWTTKAFINGQLYGQGTSTHQECAREETAKKALDVLKAQYGMT